MINRIHWNLFKKEWTSHTYKACSHAPVLLIEGEWCVEIKPERKTNPRGWVRCDHTQVTMNPDKDKLDEYELADKLIYDKTEMSFNILSGENLICDKTGCYLARKVR